MKLDPQIFIELNKFRHVLFRERDHKYFINGQQAHISTTGLIHRYSSHFAKEHWAQKKATEYGVTRDEVVEAWDYMNLHAVTEGSILHDFNEALMGNKLKGYPEDKIREIFRGADAIRSSYMMMQEQAIQFHKDISGKLIPVRSELVIGDSEWMLGGMVDQLFWNEKDQEFQIWDWKTNTDLKTSSQYQMADPIEHLPDCELVHYYLQLTIYKRLIERNTNLKIGKMFIVWFNENNPSYKIYPVKNVEEEVTLIINDWLSTKTVTN